MSDFRQAGWMATVAEVERAVGECIASLDRYETAFASVLAEPAEAAAPSVASRLADDTGDWGDRLAVARRHVSELEQVLDEQERAWAEWRDSFNDWRRSLEQLPR